LNQFLLLLFFSYIHIITFFIELQNSSCSCVFSCKAVQYRKDLPTASIVIVFCNEAPSAILRTIHSVVNRTPPQYLHEFVLLDDASDRRKFLLSLSHTHALFSSRFPCEHALAGCPLDYLSPFINLSRWRHNWKSAQVVNSHLVCDPTIRQPGFDLTRQQWSLLNRFCTEQGHCCACRRK